MDPKLWWYLSRATGLVAWALALASILFGLALASRALGARPKAPWLLALHRWLGALTVLFVVAHVGAVVADSYVHFGAADVLVPFASGWRTGAVAWGIVAWWLLVAIEVTSLQMRRLPKRAWRAVHVTSYAVGAAATLHGLAAGADTANPLFAWTAIGSVAAGVFFVVYRRLAPRRAAGVRRREVTGPPSAGRGVPVPDVAR